MATFYGQIKGMSGTAATRRGSRDSHIFASLQSYNGSVQTELFYDDAGALCIQVYTADGSQMRGRTVYRGTVAEFVDACTEGMRVKNSADRGAGDRGGLIL